MTIEAERPRMGMTCAGHGEPFALMHGTFVQQRFAPHMHDSYAIGVIERGAARLRYRGSSVMHAAGDVIVIEPGEVHTGEAAVPQGWTYRMLYPPAPVMAWIAEATALPAMPSFASSVYTDARLAPHLSALHAALAGGAEPLEAEERLVHVLGELLCAHGAGVQRQGAESPGTARDTSATLGRVRAYLDAHYAQVVRLQTLAEIAALSPFHLVRQFRKAYGVPPYAYIQLVRIERVKALLRAGHPISYAAHASGLSDQSHLTRIFRRVVGVPPGEYARALGTLPRSTRQRRDIGIATSVIRWVLPLGSGTSP